MKKFGTWVLDHLKLVFTILTFGITFLVIGIIMLSSYMGYKAYEKKFDQNDLDIRSLSPAQPTTIEINDRFKSSFKKRFTFEAGMEELKVTTSQENYLNGDCIDLTTSGGTISTSLELEEKSFVDIVFTISSSYKTTTEDGDDVYGVSDLLSNSGFVVNGEAMEEVVDLEGEDYHQLVMSGFALPAGPVNVTISSVSGKAAMMPQLKSITFYASQPLSMPAQE
ncbi:MAG: hypothetical protein J6T25_03880 [Bacilli bacterium]|nr:hypothetical protein [Bacilli bacterium]